MDNYLFNSKDLKSILSILSIVEALTEEEKEKLAKIKKKMKKKVGCLHIGNLKGILYIYIKYYIKYVSIFPQIVILGAID